MGELSAVDVFCGAGGMTRGLKDAGLRVLAGIDVDPAAIETYKANHPDVPAFCRDVKTLNPRALMEELDIRPGELDLLGGCPPCQGFSSLRTSRVDCSEDKRNSLVANFAGCIEAFRPRAILMENVPGILRTDIFSQFAKRVERLGYRARYKILNVKDYGVAQNRRRAVFAANRTRILVKSGSVREAKTVRSVIGQLGPAGKSGDELHDIPETRTARIRRLIAEVPENGGNLPEELKLPCHHRTPGYGDVYGRMAWDKPSPTITGGCCQPSKGRFLHPEENRCITLREAALLQGFAADYQFPVKLGKMKLAELIGNAVPPPFVAAQPKMIL